MNKEFIEKFNKLDPQDQQEILNLIDFRFHYGHDTCYKCWWNKDGVCLYHGRNEAISKFVTDPSKSCCVHFERE